MSDHEQRVRDDPAVQLSGNPFFVDLRALLADLDAARAELASVKGLWLESCISANAAGRAAAETDLATAQAGWNIALGVLDEQATNALAAHRTLAAKLARCEEVLRSVRVKSSVEQVRFAADAYFADKEPRT